MAPVGHLHVFFRKMSVQFLCPFSHWVVCLLMLSGMSSLHILDINLFSDTAPANTLSSSIHSPFGFLHRVFLVCSPICLLLL